jgi:peptidoglycan/xylan/chitin deacetylase (PgdA/CDA1 family)
MRERSAPVVLAYHRISRRPLWAGTWITPRRLAKQIDALLAAGHRLLAPGDERYNASPTTAVVGSRPVLLTFDDGTVDLVEHGAVLAERGCAGIVFVPAALIGCPNHWEWRLPGRATRHLTGGELRQLATAGWEIGLHGAHHRDLTALAPDRLDEELTGGRRRLEDAVGCAVHRCAYPYGRTDPRVAAAASAAGFSEGFVLTRAPRGVPGSLARTRRPVYCIDSTRDLLAKVIDPRGRTVAGKWERFKEEAAHGVGRWCAAARPRHDRDR